MRGFAELNKPVAGTCQVFGMNYTDYLLKHSYLIHSDVVLSDQPFILLRTRLYNERRKEYEQKQKSASALVC